MKSECPWISICAHPEHIAFVRQSCFRVIEWRPQPHGQLFRSEACLDYDQNVYIIGVRVAGDKAAPHEEATELASALRRFEKALQSGRQVLPTGATAPESSQEVG
jgi:hypothetical protein